MNYSIFSVDYATQWPFLGSLKIFLKWMISEHKGFCYNFVNKSTVGFFRKTSKMLINTSSQL